MGGTRMFIEVNSDVGVEDLLRGLLIQSGNDAAVALAEHVAGSVDAFVGRDERSRESARHAELRVPQSARPAGARPLHDGARSRDSREGDHRRVPGLLQPLRRARVQLQRHRAAQPQRAAVARPERRRHEDRLYRSGRLLPRDLGRARRHAPDRRRAGRAERRGCATTARRSCSSTASRTSRRTSSTRRAKRSTTRASGAASSSTRAWGSPRTSTSRSRAARTTKLAASMDVMAQLAAPLVRGTAVGEVKVSFDGDAARRRARSSCSPTSWTAASGRACATSCRSFGNERRRRVAAEVSVPT